MRPAPLPAAASPRPLPEPRPGLSAAMLAVAGCLWLGGCARAPLPAAADSAAARAPWPALVPLEQVIALPAPEDPAPGLAARAAALRKRAAALRAAG